MAGYNPPMIVLPSAIQTVLAVMRLVKSDTPYLSCLATHLVSVHADYAKAKDGCAPPQVKPAMLMLTQASRHRGSACRGSLMVAGFGQPDGHVNRRACRGHHLHCEGKVPIKSGYKSRTKLNSTSV